MNKLQDLNVKEKQIQDDWDVYWSDKNKQGSFLYNIIAKLYRRFLIKNLRGFALFIRNSASSLNNVIL